MTVFPQRHIKREGGIGKPRRGSSSELRFDQTIMRQYLINCLLNGKMKAFPVISTRKNSNWRPRKQLSIDLNCICKMPFSEKDSGMPEKYRKVVQCLSCKIWYHPEWESIPDTTLYIFGRGSLVWGEFGGFKRSRRRKVRLLSFVCVYCSHLEEGNPFSFFYGQEKFHTKKSRLVLILMTLFRILLRI